MHEPRYIPGRKWNAATDDRKRQIILLLAKGAKSFSEMHETLRSHEKHGRAKWAKITLNICLEEMLKEHLIVKEGEKRGRGKRGLYSLVNDHPFVVETLKQNVTMDDSFRNINADKFISLWLNSQKFAFVALLNDLTSGWKDEKNLEDQIQSDIGDFVDLLNVCSDILVQRIKAGIWSRERLQEIQKELHLQVKKQWSINGKPVRESQNQEP